MARRIAARGYFCLLPDLYYRLGLLRFDIPRRNNAMSVVIRGAMDSLSNAAVAEDTAGMIAFLDAQDRVKPGPVGCVGHCMSGPFIATVAAQFPSRIAAAAALYGIGIVTDQPDSPHLLLDRVKGELIRFRRDRSGRAGAGDQGPRGGAQAHEAPPHGEDHSRHASRLPVRCKSRLRARGGGGDLGGALFALGANAAVVRRGWHGLRAGGTRAPRAHPGATGAGRGGLRLRGARGGGTRRGRGGDLRKHGAPPPGAKRPALVAGSPPSSSRSSPSWAGRPFSARAAAWPTRRCSRGWRDGDERRWKRLASGRSSSSPRSRCCAFPISFRGSRARCCRCSACRRARRQFGLASGSCC